MLLIQDRLIYYRRLLDYKLNTNNMKKINEVYKEVEKNKVKGPKVVTMKLCDFIEEHECLIKTLREGSREELLAEAEKQEEELEEYVD
jgi:hypothetical protein